MEAQCVHNFVKLLKCLVDIKCKRLWRIHISVNILYLFFVRKTRFALNISCSQIVPHKRIPKPKVSVNFLKVSWCLKSSKWKFKKAFKKLFNYKALKMSSRQSFWVLWRKHLPLLLRLFKLSVQFSFIFIFIVSSYWLVPETKTNFERFSSHC